MHFALSSPEEVIVAIGIGRSGAAWLIAFGVLLHVSSLSANDCVEVTANAKAALEGDPYRAHESALRRAYYAAVEQGLGVFVQHIISVKNYKEVVSLMLSESVGFVSDIEELESGALNTTEYQVTIRATVCKGAVSTEQTQRVARLFNRYVLGCPTVGLILQGNETRESATMAATVLSNELQAAGFRVIDLTRTEVGSTIKTYLLSPPHTPTADMLSHLSGYQAIMLCNFEATDPERPTLDALSGFRSVHSSLSVNVYRMPSPDIALSDLIETTGLGVSGKQAMAKSIDRLGTLLRDRPLRELMSLWSSTPRNVTLILKSATSEDATDLTDLISQLEDVFAVRLEQWRDSDSVGVVIVEMDPIVGTPTSLWKSVRSRSRGEFKLEAINDDLIVLRTAAD